MAINFSAELQSGGNFPLVDSDAIRGGYRSVDTLKELEQIPKGFIKEGMVCLVNESLIPYQYRRGRWIEFNRGAGGVAPYGVPVLTQLMADDLGDKVPKDHIIIPNPSDLEGEITGNTYTTTDNGNYIDILFSAIRALLSEVAKLRNSFKYGINSYNEDKTAISTNYGEMKSPDEEPLWAVEEDSLSELIACTVPTNSSASDFIQGTYTADDENDILDISNALFIDPDDGFKSLKDPKSFLFLTSSNLNINISLSNNKNIDLTKLTIPNIANLYNILVIVSKKTTKNIMDPTLYGENFIWIKITNALSNKSLSQGYYDETDTLNNHVVLLDDSCYIDSIRFSNLYLSKFNSYTKLLDFSEEVIPDYPDDSEYKFGAAHITIRSVKNLEILDKIENYVLDNELIWITSTKELKIKSNGKIYSIGSNKNKDDDTMTIEELIDSLKTLGIKVENEGSLEAPSYKLKLDNLASVIFIHEETNTKFKLTIDSQGNLRTIPLNTIPTFKERIEKAPLSDVNTRGFISKLLLAEYKKLHPDENIEETTVDAKLNSDRLKIGAIYAPQPGRSVFGCSHAYVELENTSDKSFNLEGCSLHVSYPGISGNEVQKIDLTGTIPAGGTYLIRGKLYAKFEDSNTFIKVKTYDQEWYVKGSLIDFQKPHLTFLLRYGNDPVTWDQTFVQNGPKSIWLMQDNNFIDYAPVRSRESSNWLASDVTFKMFDSEVTRDYILKNMFELDPAKQAFLGLTKSDCSRVRGQKNTDFREYYIDEPYVIFPHSPELRESVSMITPKASFEHKNVSTDKTKLDLNKPNMVYCAFGIDMHTTRCFNWISVGYYNEYVWVREKGTTKWDKFESYKSGEDLEQQETVFKRKSFSLKILNYVYKRMTGRFPGDGTFYTSHKCIITKESAVLKPTTYEYIVGRAMSTDGTPDLEHTSKIKTFTLYPKGCFPKVYLVTDQQGFYWLHYQTWAGSAHELDKKMASDIKSATEHPFIPILVNTGDMTLNGTRVNEWIDYYKAGECLFDKYEHMAVVGNNDLCNTDINALGTGDDEGKSNGYYFHVFFCYEINSEDLIVNNKYIPSLYYFDCELPKQKKFRFTAVNSEITFINCRDWFGLKHEIEDETYNIYTGWTVCSNATLERIPSYTSSFTPIYNILYTWLDNNNRNLVMCHEMPFTVITRVNLMYDAAHSEYLEKTRSTDASKGTLVGSKLNQLTTTDFACPQWFSRLLEFKHVKLVIGGHKHTYTCTYPLREFYFYGEGYTQNSLQNGPMPMEATLANELKGPEKIPATKWSYVKHSEDNLLVNNNGNFNTSELNGKHASFIIDEKPFDTSKTPLVKFGESVLKVIFGDLKSTTPYSESDLNTNFLPIIGVPELTEGVIYFMCQATGFKQTSNKELPGYAQAFTKLLPLTSPDKNKDDIKNTKDKPSAELQLPMFAIISYDEANTTVQLARVINIQYKAAEPLFNKDGCFSKLPTSLEYIKGEGGDYIQNRYGIWNNESTNIVVKINEA